MVGNTFKNMSKKELLDYIEENLENEAGIIWEKQELEEEKVKTLLEKKSIILKEEKNKEIQTDNKKPTNILIEGDNYHALSVLQYTHQGEIDVIYIDPPYNVLKDDWKYNNKFVNPDNKWRHSKWLAFMEKRLRLAKKLLAKDGIICCTIDDFEVAKLWLLMEKIFDEKHFLGTAVIRNNPGGRKRKRQLALQHEYALFFSKSDSTNIKEIIIYPEDKTHNYKKDRKTGKWYEKRNLRKDGIDSLLTIKNKKHHYPIYYDPKTKKLSTTKKYKITILPINTDNQKVIWRAFAKGKIETLYKNNEIFVRYSDANGWQLDYKYWWTGKGETPKTIWDKNTFSAGDYGSKILKQILGKRESFPYPKSPYATAECIKAASDKKDAVILDFFGGSGTTGHAVLELNKEDGGNRKFILCTNNENNICTQVCYPRIKNVINGYTQKASKSQKIKGLGGNLKYYKIDFENREDNHNQIKKFAKISTEILCLKEDCFELIEKKKDFSAFGNASGKRMCIIYNYPAIKSCINYINEIKRTIPDGEKINVYEFSSESNETHADEFDKKGILDLVNLYPFPNEILRTFDNITKQ